MAFGLQSFPHYEAKRSFPSAQIMARDPTVSPKHSHLCAKWHATRQKCRPSCRANCLPDLCFHIHFRIDVHFNIFMAQCAPPARPSPPRLDEWVLSVPRTLGGATPSCARLALHRMVDAAEGTKPIRCFAPAPISVFDLRFWLSSFTFI
jgi:hypothetical protein